MGNGILLYQDLVALATMGVPRLPPTIQASIQRSEEDGNGRAADRRWTEVGRVERRKDLFDGYSSFGEASSGVARNAPRAFIRVEIFLFILKLQAHGTRTTMVATLNDRKNIFMPTPRCEIFWEGSLKPISKSKTKGLPRGSAVDCVD